MSVSMTGFGRGSCSEDGRELTVELRSVNHRYLDLSIRCDRQIAFVEDVMRKNLSSQLNRGHIDVYLHYRNQKKVAQQLHLDEALLFSYQDMIQQAADLSGLDNDVSLGRLLAFDGVICVEEMQDDEELIATMAEQAVKSALQELSTMRANEGARLVTDLLLRLDTMQSIVGQIEAQSVNASAASQAKLRERLEKLLENRAKLDEGRLENEIALIADRTDISEELVRLDSHLQSMRALLEKDEPVGRKLDFLSQEIHRECNTIGSKSNDERVASLVIDAKAELERIREQVQNIE